ncbi:MAG: hypothetical protein ACK4I8_11710 [Armatimonadota bacterium]
MRRFVFPCRFSFLFGISRRALLRSADFSAAQESSPPIVTIFFFWFSAAQESGTTIDSLTTVGDEPRRYLSPVNPDFPTSRLAERSLPRLR